MNTQKGFASILVVLLGLIVVGGGVYFYKEKNDLNIPNEEATDSSRLILDDIKNENNDLNQNTEEKNTEKESKSIVKKENNENSNSSALKETQSTSIDSSWLTYSNEENGLSLKYPLNWVVEKGVNGSLVRIHPQTEILREGGLPINQVILREEFCDDRDWNIGFGYANYKDFNLSSSLCLKAVALSSDMKIIEDQILNSFSKTNSTKEIFIQAILNGNYFFSADEKSYQFIDGKYYFKNVSGKSSSDIRIVTNYPDNAYSRTIFKDNIALGNLTNNTMTDAAIIIEDIYGGQGRFSSLVILRNVAEHAYDSPIFQPINLISLGDRQTILSLKIEDNLIKIEYITQGEGEALCCGTKKVSRAFRILDNKIIEINL